MMIQFINKPFEEMTLDELKAERRAHIWLAKSMERLNEILVYKVENYSESDPNEEMAQVKADYFAQLIDDEEFMKAKREVKRLAKTRERHTRETLEKADYALTIARAHRGLAAEIEEMISDIKFKQEKCPKKKVLPKTYGYDPRKNISKFNYPRHDWGETRQNQKEHRTRRGR